MANKFMEVEILDDVHIGTTFVFTGLLPERYLNLGDYLELWSHVSGNDELIGMGMVTAILKTKNVYEGIRIL